MINFVTNHISIYEDQAKFKKYYYQQNSYWLYGHSE